MKKMGRRETNATKKIEEDGNVSTKSFQITDALPQGPQPAVHGPRCRTFIAALRPGRDLVRWWKMGGIRLAALVGALGVVGGI